MHFCQMFKILCHIFVFKRFSFKKHQIAQIRGLLTFFSVNVKVRIAVLTNIQNFCLVKLELQ